MITFQIGRSHAKTLRQPLGESSGALLPGSCQLWLPAFLVSWMVGRQISLRLAVFLHIRLPGTKWARFSNQTFMILAIRASILACLWSLNCKSIILQAQAILAFVCYYLWILTCSSPKLMLEETLSHASWEGPQERDDMQFFHKGSKECLAQESGKNVWIW